MKFGMAQVRKFKASDGAYSQVTDDEKKKSQVTLTDYEANLVIGYFKNENIHVGDVGSNEEKALKQFKLYPEGDTISLNLVYPKPEKPELRLYTSIKRGFKPDGGDIWFTFVKDDELWIGSLPESQWRLEFSEFRVDPNDELYQLVVSEGSEIKTSLLKQRESFVRDRRIALARMELSGFKCDYDSNHALFNSRFSRKPYLEAHHMIPIGLQDAFPERLDALHNVYCLCPNCHRAIHFAEEQLAREMILRLTKGRPILDHYSISITDLYGLYAVEPLEDSG